MEDEDDGQEHLFGVPVDDLIVDAIFVIALLVVALVVGGLLLA